MSAKLKVATKVAIALQPGENNNSVILFWRSYKTYTSLSLYPGSSELSRYLNCDLKKPNKSQVRMHLLTR